MIKKQKSAIEHKKGVFILFEGSCKVIPFNVVLAIVLSPVLYYNKVPNWLIGAWLGCMVFVSLIRWLYCKWALKKIASNDPNTPSIRIFALLAALMGATWVSIYFVAHPYLLGTQENAILLVFAGMCAGAISSLSVYPIAYYSYLISMLLPVIIYNYWITGLDQTILATMTLAFACILIIESKGNEKLLTSTLNLSEEKEFLITKLEHISITDPLTGLYNRRYYNAKLPEEYNRSKRNKYAFTLVSIDIDNFKLINDNLGHTYGDKFLVYTADLLANNMKRANDTVFRLGGDEFVAILANSSVEEAKQVCEKIKLQFKQENFPPLNDDELVSKYQEVLQKVTLSIGLVDVSHESTAKVEDIITEVDRALYKAKNAGKNKIIAYSTTT